MNRKIIGAKAFAATKLVLPGGNPEGRSRAEMDKLLQSYELANQARYSFLRGEITLDEFCQLLEQHEINIDSYLETLETNLYQLKVL